ncbi:potassium channel family protein [Calidifontibacillus erzurumensis]|uniref:Potassium channel family protein n=1 Tax=Calidifontibacillus erzurumensis TaxID=2741433 RepID=A0A8J8GD50_9BACI|nr:potassium channel family protein [Calidifontibacillus erzurumensis]NSL51649.1 potassium channel family protein [Calidifontibacillus erzurumensis]
MLYLFNKFRQLHIIVRLIIIIVVFHLIFGTAMHFIEPITFPTIFDGIWWVLITTTTIGYGDYVPETTIGRACAMVLILSGAAFVAYYMVTVATTIFNTLNALNEGSAAYNGTEHIIIIGWNEKTKNVIRQIHKMNPLRQIVLIDETLQDHPLTNKNVYFVKGNPTTDETLKRANIEKADTVLITADQQKSENEADMQSILTLLAVKGLNPLVYCIVELLTQEQVNNALRAGADELVETSFLSSIIMTTNIHAPGLSKPILSLLHLTKENRLATVKAPDELIQHPFAQAVQLLIEKEMLAIGIKKGEKYLIHPSQALQIEKNDELLVIVKGEVEQTEQ